MLKNASYKEKFSMLRPWMPAIVKEIRKELKNDHLRGDLAFVKRHFGSKDITKLTSEELAEAYNKAITEEGSDDIAEFIVNRWLIKNSEVYDYFATELGRDEEDFSTLEELESSRAIALMEEAVQLFGAPKVYKFSVLNAVVFPRAVFDQLAERARKEADDQEKEEVERQVHEVAAKERRQLELEMARLVDKYEKKIAGLQKQYLVDTTALKKQIASMQKKLTTIHTSMPSSPS